MALLAGATAIAAQQAGVIPPNLDGKQVIPYVLAWVSDGTEHFLGIVAIATLAVPALGLGSSVLRVQTRTFFDLEMFSQWFGDRPTLKGTATHNAMAESEGLRPWESFRASQALRILVAVINVLLALTIALRGGEIVDLILLFYAAYLSAAWIPLIAYLLDYFNVYTFSTNSVKLALLMGSTSALAGLLLVLVEPELVIFGSDRLTVAVSGLSMATMSLLINEAAGKLLPILTVKKETGS